MKPSVDASKTYRLIVARRNASEILLLRTDSVCALPRLDIDPQARLAEQLTSGLGKSPGLESYCLLVPNLSKCDSADEPKCALMESVRQNDQAPAGTFWAPSSGVSDFVDPSEVQLIREALDELNIYAANQKPGPFARLGWLRDLLIWVQDQLTPFGMRLTGGFRQLNASPTFSLIRLESDHGAVWFKATGEPNSHELHVTQAAACLFPGYVPKIIAIHDAWNGWLSKEAVGVPLGETEGFSAWQRTAEELAKIQIASIGKTRQLLKGESKDLRIPKLTERIDPFLARMKDLMALQEKATPAPLTESELATLREGLKESCKLLENFGLPDTLGHIDLNPGNVLVSGNGCVFLDWAEACVSNPLLTLEYLRQHMAKRISRPAAAECLTAAYLGPWMSFHSPDDLRRALELAPLIAVYAYAVANDSWRSAGLAGNLRLAGYLRSLTRRMYREAVHSSMRSELCLS
jgi:Phosphotransferase enzyme family